MEKFDIRKEYIGLQKCYEENVKLSDSQKYEIKRLKRVPMWIRRIFKAN